MRLALPVLVVAIGALPAAARAQSKDDIARADTLFNAGKALTDAGQYGDACAKFAESKRLAPGLGITLYLADCYEHVGRNASAWTEFRSAEGLARERNDKRADMARGRAQALEPKLCRLTIVLAPTIPRSGLQVLRDGIPLAQEELGLPIPVDPGPHVIAVSSQGHKAQTFDARVEVDGQTATVQVDSLDDVSAPPALPATLTAISTPPSTSSIAATLSPTPVLPPGEQPTAFDRGATRRWMALGIGGLGVAGIGVGSAFGVVAMSKRDQSNSGPCDATDHCDAKGRALRKEAETAATGSTIGFIAGGVALAAGLTLYVTAPRGGTSFAVTIAPAPIGGGGGAIVRARF